MPADLGAIASQLFEGVMAPLVLGGPMRPAHAIGARAALKLGDEHHATVDADLHARVQVARVRRARHLAPIDTLPPPAPAEWRLAAALHDVVQSASPVFDAVLRRRAAARILELAGQVIERVSAPLNAREALSRHTWFARLLEIARTDAAVSWWTGSRTFLGVEPPARLQAWPDLRRVSVVRTPRALLELTPIAVDRERLVQTVNELLGRTPLTEIATCTRPVPAFAWGEASLALVSTRVGRTLALRALHDLPALDVDASLGVATRLLLVASRARAGPAVALLADRALAQAQSMDAERRAPIVARRPDAVVARAIGAAVALESMAGTEARWRPDEWRRIQNALVAATRSPEAQQAVELLG